MKSLLIIQIILPMIVNIVYKMKFVYVRKGGKKEKLNGLIK